MKDEMTYTEFERRYTSPEHLGSGGFAIVLKVFDEENNHYVAMKKMPVNPEHKHFTLEREVELVNQLPLHPNIARYDTIHRFTIGMAGEIDFAILQYYEHGNLEQFLASHTLTPTEQRQVIKGILRGIDFLHSHRCIHRDLKSQNILLNRENGVWIPKITDFGLSRLADAETSLANSSIAVSPAFAAPEQLLGQSIHYNVDLWAAGVIIYRIVAGELPFRSSVGAGEASSHARIEITKKILNLELPEKLDSLPAPYQEMIRQCLIRSANERVQSAKELLAILDGQQVPAAAAVQSAAQPAPAAPEPLSKNKSVPSTPSPEQNPPDITPPPGLQNRPPAPPPPTVENKSAQEKSPPPPTNIETEHGTEPAPSRQEPPPAPVVPQESAQEQSSRKRRWLLPLLLLLAIGAGLIWWISASGSRPWEKSYEHALTSFGNSDTTFAFLRSAARQAIRAGEAEKMRSRLQSDAAQFFQLAADSAAWNTLLMALDNQDSTLLTPPPPAEVETQDSTTTTGGITPASSPTQRKPVSLPGVLKDEELPVPDPGQTQPPAQTTGIGGTGGTPAVDTQSSQPKVNPDPVEPPVSTPPKPEDPPVKIEPILPDSPPTYPRGKKELEDFITRNRVYPKKAWENDVTGTVKAQFYVETDGTIHPNNIKIIRDIGDGCGEEAIRLIKMMGKWNPAIKNGQPIREKWYLDVKFEIKD